MGFRLFFGILKFLKKKMSYVQFNLFTFFRKDQQFNQGLSAQKFSGKWKNIQKKKNNQKA